MTYRVRVVIYFSLRLQCKPYTLNSEIHLGLTCTSNSKNFQIILVCNCPLVTGLKGMLHRKSTLLLLLTRERSKTVTLIFISEGQGSLLPYLCVLRLLANALMGWRSNKASFHDLFSRFLHAIVMTILCLSGSVPSSIFFDSCGARKDSLLMTRACNQTQFYRLLFP